MGDDINVPDGMERGSQLDADADAPADLADEILAELEAIDEDNTRKQLGIRDAQIAALIRGIEANPERMDDVADAFRDELGIEGEGDVTRSEVLRLAVRYAFREVTPESVEALREANRRKSESVF